MKRFLQILVVLMMGWSVLQGQGALRYNLDTTGQTYLKASLRAQLWGQVYADEPRYRYLRRAHQ